MKFPLKILLLEDNKLDAELIQEFVKKEGLQCEFFNAFNKKEFINAIKNDTFDIIFADYSLPDYDGLSALKYVLEKTPSTPLIFVSGSVNEETAIQALRIGAADYVFKDKLEKLLPAVLKVIDKANAQESAQINSEKLKESEKRYRLLFNNMMDAFSVYEILYENNLPVDYRYIEVNPKFEELTGKKAKDIIGKTMRQVFPNVSNEWLEIFNNAALSGQPLHVNKFSEDINKWVDVKLFIPEKGILTLIFSDITERVKSVKEFAKLSTQTKLILESAGEGIYGLDLNGNSVFVNQSAARMLGYKVEELIGKQMHKNHHYKKIDGTDYKREDCFIYKAFSDGKTYRINDEVFWKKDGTPFPVEYISTPIFEERKVVGAVVVFNDISEKIKSLNELLKAKTTAEEMNKLKDFFLSNMSHELRTPLISILGFADILQNEIKDPEQIELLNQIYEGGKRLELTLNSILDLSKAQSSQSQIYFENTKAAEQTLIVADIIKNQAKLKNISFNFFILDNDVQINIDKELFGKVLFHIFNNSIKYTKQGSVTIKVRSEIIEDKKWAVIDCIDTGIGISKDSQNKIFEEFRQESEGYNRSYEGIGVGLTIANKFANLMGGHITVESKIHHGSKFSIYFPSVFTDEEIQKEVEKKRQTLISESVGQTAEELIHSILLVEDNLGNRILIKRYLDSLCKIEEAVDGITALTLAEQKHFPLVLMDINLGEGMDGIETMKRMRKLDGYESSKFIAVTAYVLPEDKQKFFDEGFDDFLGKPFLKQELIELLKKNIN